MLWNKSKGAALKLMKDCRDVDSNLIQNVWLAVDS